MLTDPIADMLTRIRNANQAMHDRADLPTSRLKEQIARILKEEGYIRDFKVVEGESFNTLVVELKYGKSRERVITGIKRVSKPGRRVYARQDRLPRVLGGMGTAILSTSKGVITSRNAEKEGIGGEVICFARHPSDRPRPGSCTARSDPDAGCQHGRGRHQGLRAQA